MCSKYPWNLDIDRSCNEISFEACLPNLRVALLLPMQIYEEIY